MTHRVKIFFSSFRVFVIGATNGIMTAESNGFKWVSPPWCNRPSYCYIFSIGHVLTTSIFIGRSQADAPTPPTTRKSRKEKKLKRKKKQPIKYKKHKERPDGTAGAAISARIDEGSVYWWCRRINNRGWHVRTVEVERTASAVDRHRCNRGHAGHASTATATGCS